MPPKRKNTETAMGDKQSSAKTAKTVTTTAAGAVKEKKHKSKPTKAEKAIKAQAKATAADLEAKASLEDDEDFDKEQIGPAGIAKLCEDIDVSLETVDMLVLAYHLEADTMPIFTKDEWAKGMKKLEIDSVERLKAKLPGLVEKLKDPAHFKEFYRYIFMFAKDSEQKCMPVDTACAMISTVMKGRPHEQRFVEYLGVKKPIKVINKDQWYNFLDFSDTISEDLSNYDGLSSAWPVLLDEYVEWRNGESA
ncbi:DCN1-like protein 5 [Linnemannia schmuckeri]|uniref:Defective in cullin neddylation protein n=1 Tax=Linnemannia schmuckeri TaxID=64567 RepID=A0A9P5S623_9FUNG|nr:DCN1-like protein 5 [Linnemannia schmuckeri]